MLNPFPIQFLALYAYLILRVFLGIILLRLGIIHYAHRHELRQVLTLPWFPYGNFTALLFAIGEIVIALMFITGFYTQIAALAAIGMSIKMVVWRQHFAHPTIPQKLFYTLLLGASISLFITGAGHLAFDLPI